MRRIFWAFGLVAIACFIALRNSGSGEVCEHIAPGTRAVVCGASEGIGREIALAYSRCGAHVVLASRRQAVLEAVKEECMAEGASSVKVIAGDLSTEEGASSLVDGAVRHFRAVKSAEGSGRSMDVLVLNHIMPFFDHWDDIVDPIARTQRIVAVNTLSYVYITTAALPHLRQLDGHGKRGMIGVVSSQAGKMGLPKVAPYSLSKHALHGFFDSLRHDIESSDEPFVDITLCVLGSIDTANARKNTAGKLSERVVHHPPDDCARHIVRSIAEREREMYYPYWELRLLNVARVLFPSTVDAVVRWVMSA